MQGAFGKKKSSDVFSGYLTQLLKAAELSEDEKPKLLVQRTSKLIAQCGMRGILRSRPSIIVSNPLAQMLEDVAIMHAAWLRWTTDNATQVLYSGEITPETMRESFNQAVIAFFETKNQWPSANHFQLFRDDLERTYVFETIEFSGSRYDFAQMYFDQMILFVLAHELGHIRLGHIHEPKGASIDNERFADEYAAELVIDKVYSSMNLKDNGVPFDYWSAGAASAVALIFTINSAFEKAAAMRSKPWLEHHSPAFDRFVLFKEYCTSHLSISREIFETPVALHPPAQKTFDLWQAMIWACQFEPPGVS